MRRGDHGGAILNVVRDKVLLLLTGREIWISCLHHLVMILLLWIVMILLLIVMVNQTRWLIPSWLGKLSLVKLLLLFLDLRVLADVVMIGEDVLHVMGGVL